MQCAFCKEIIDDDSFYCDMCGEEIKTCPRCKIPAKGRNCTSCGTALVTIKSQAGPSVESVTNAGAQTPLFAAGKAPDHMASVSGVQRLPDNESVTTAVPQLRLMNKNINVDIKIEDGSIIGRTTGPYVAIFGRFNQVSGKHCRFNYDPLKGWCVTDLGSTFKTKYNNRELVPNIPQYISDQTFLKIASGDQKSVDTGLKLQSIEFFVRVISG